MSYYSTISLNSQFHAPNNYSTLLTEFKLISNDSINKFEEKQKKKQKIKDYK